MSAVPGDPPVPEAAQPPDAAAVEALVRFVQAHPRLFVLTGAGISCAAGIPEYRDREGQWKRPPPVQLREFVGNPARRGHYWLRSLSGWPRVRAARPTTAHRALAAWQESGHVHRLVTQNVDGLHQRAGSTGVIDLHGRLDQVVCLGCRALRSRDAVQEALLAGNPGLTPAVAGPGAPTAPDGDADLPDALARELRIPCCERCGGMLKPDVVFFGESVPKARVTAAFRDLQASDGVLVVGSSLMVYSGYRFVRAAAAAGQPLALVNQGRTRADGLWSLDLRTDCGPLLEAVTAALSRG